MPDDSVDEISRLLFVSFSEQSQVKISELIRFWSLELQWMGPHEAKIVIDKLSDSGWLVNEHNLLKSAEGIEEIQPNLGWRPIYRLISNPPVFVHSEILVPKTEENEEPQIVVNVIQSNPHSTKVVDRPPDRSEGNIPKLIKLISHQSRLDNREVVRRAQRKRRSLGPVTLWMALALVAREQGLDMVEIVSVIETV
jgi:hypothetical protein